MSVYLMAVLLLFTQNGFSTPYGSCGDHVVHAVFVSESGDLSLRVFSIEKNEYEMVKDCLFDQSRKLAIENKIVDFGKTGYGFLWKGGHLSFFVKEVARPDGKRNVYLEIAPQQQMTLEGKILTLNGSSKNDH